MSGGFCAEPGVGKRVDVQSVHEWRVREQEWHVREMPARFLLSALEHVSAKRKA